MAKAKNVETEIRYIPPHDNRYWVYIGEKFYRRLQPIPYAYKQPKIKNIKKSILVK